MVVVGSVGIRGKVFFYFYVTTFVRMGGDQVCVCVPVRDGMIGGSDPIALASGGPPGPPALQLTLGVLFVCELCCCLHRVVCVPNSVSRSCETLGG